jgi:hypothetical protein
MCRLRAAHVTGAALAGVPPVLAAAVAASEVVLGEVAGTAAVWGFDAGDPHAEAVTAGEQP